MMNSERVLRPSLASCLVCLGLLSACAPTTLTPTSFATNYSPELEAVSITPAPPCAKVKEVIIKDQRKNKSVAGYRAPESHRAAKQPINLEDGGERWFQAGAEHNLKLAALSSAKGGEATIEIHLMSLDLQEVTYRNAEYEARVLLEAHVTNERSATDYRVAGTADNYGSPGDDANYNETINLALDRAMAELLNEGSLFTALCPE